LNPTRAERHGIARHGFSGPLIEDAERQGQLRAYERLWQSLKHGGVDLKDYAEVPLWVQRSHGVARLSFAIL